MDSTTTSNNTNTSINNAVHADSAKEGKVTDEKRMDVVELKLSELSASMNTLMRTMNAHFEAIHGNQQASTQGVLSIPSNTPMKGSASVEEKSGGVPNTPLKGMRSARTTGSDTMMDDELDGTTMSSAGMSLGMSKMMSLPKGDHEHGASHPHSMTTSDGGDNHRSTSSGPTAPVDMNVKLPAADQLKLSNVSMDQFVAWKNKLINNARGVPRCDGILTMDIDKSWTLFISRNRRYTPQQLEEHYVLSHRMIWSNIMSAIDPSVSIQLENMFRGKDPSTTIAHRLKFTNQEVMAYENAYDLLQALEDRYMQKSPYRFGQMFKALSELRYNDREDPQKFIAEYHDVHTKGRLMISFFPMYDDQAQAHDMLERLPPRLNFIRQQFYTRNTSVPLTTSEIEAALTNWWIDQGHKYAHGERKPLGNQQQEGKSHRNWAHKSKRDEDETPEQAHATIPSNENQQKYKGKNDKSSSFNSPPNASKTEGSNSGGRRGYSIWDQQKKGTGTDSKEGPIHLNFTAVVAAGTTMSGNANGFMPNRTHLVWDSACTSTISPLLERVNGVKQITPVNVVTMTGTRTIDREGVLPVGKLEIAKTKYMPDAPFSLFAMCQAVDGNYDIVLTQDKAYAIPRGAGVLDDRSRLEQLSKFTGTRRGGLWVTELGNGDERTAASHPLDSNKCDNIQANPVTTRLQRREHKVEDVAAVEEPPRQGNTPSTHQPPLLSQSMDVKRETELQEISSSFDQLMDTHEEKPTESMMIWHAKLGHTGMKGVVRSLDMYDIHHPKTNDHTHRACDTCIVCKATRMAIKRRRADPPRKPTSPMDCWCVDLMGPFSTFTDEGRKALCSLGGHNYALNIVDEYSRYVIVSLLVGKSDATNELIRWIKQKQVKTGKTLKVLHSDGGGEFDNSTLKVFLADNGTQQSFTTAGTSEHNGITERMNRTLETISRCLIKHADAPRELWPEALLHSVDIVNHISQGTIQGEIPYQRFHQEKPVMDLRKLHVFGCDAFIMLSDNPGKFDPRSEEGVYLGYDQPQNAHRVLVLSTMKEKVSRNVTFKDDSFTHLKLIGSQIVSMAEQKVSDLSSEDRKYEVSHIDLHRVFPDGRTRYRVHWKRYKKPTWEPESTLMEDCPEAIEKYKQWALTEHGQLAISLGTVIDYKEPNSYSAALRHSDAPRWIEATNEELKSLMDQHIATPAYLPKGRKALRCRWVYKVKRNDKNEIVRYKARLVVQGFLQVEGIDYSETFAPTVRLKSLKWILAVAAQNDWEIQQMDFDTAFLNAELKEDIYIQIPEGFDRSHIEPGMVLKLLKALYGLKQAPREWWKALNDLLETLDYHSSPIDECLYVKLVDGKRMFIAVYVDDTLALYPKELEGEWKKDKARISSRYKIKDIGDCEWILNMSVTRDRTKRTITLSQESYVDLVLSDQPPLSSRPVKTPFLYADLSVPPEGKEVRDLDAKEHSIYRSIVGQLLYAANITRIDLSYIVGALARHVTSPCDYHLEAAKRALRYLQGTTKDVLVLGGIPPKGKTYDIKIYADSNHAGDRVDRKSTAGWVSTMNGHPISWQSKKQSTVAVSTSEAELYGLCEAVKEALFVRQWFTHYVGYTPVIDILGDNDGALYMADHTTDHNRTKHIEVRNFFVREHVRRRKVTLHYVPTADQLADILTKATKPDVFSRLKSRLLVSMTHDPQESEDLFQ